MKRRKQLLKVIAYLTAAHADHDSWLTSFWEDPMTAECGCADEITSDRFHKHRRDVLARVRQLTGNKSPFYTLLELEKFGWKGRQYWYLEHLLFHGTP